MRISPVRLEGLSFITHIFDTKMSNFLENPFLTEIRFPMTGNDRECIKQCLQIVFCWKPACLVQNCNFWQNSVKNDGKLRLFSTWHQFLVFKTQVESKKYISNTFSSVCRLISAENRVIWCTIAKFEKIRSKMIKICNFLAHGGSFSTSKRIPNDRERSAMHSAIACRMLLRRVLRTSRC